MTAIGPCRSTTGERAKPMPPVLWPSCRFSTAYFVEIVNFAPFSELLHKGSKFLRIFFISSHLHMTLWTMKSFLEIGSHIFQKFRRQTHRRTDRCGSFIYIDVAKQLLPSWFCGNPCTLLSWTDVGEAKT